MGNAIHFRHIEVHNNRLGDSDNTICVGICQRGNLLRGGTGGSTFREKIKDNAAVHIHPGAIEETGIGFIQKLSGFRDFGGDFLITANGGESGNGAFVIA